MRLVQVVWHRMLYPNVCNRTGPQFACWEASEERRTVARADKARARVAGAEPLMNYEIMEIK